MSDVTDIVSPVRERVRKYVESLPRDILRERAEMVPPSKVEDVILPFELYRGTRRNIERIADEINLSFQHDIFDGCAVLIRRLIEILLVLSFKFHGINDEIKDADGNYEQLSSIIIKAVGSKTLDLSRNTRKYLPKLCEQGNLSAHNIFYCAGARDFDEVKLPLRVVITELLQKAGVT